MQSAADRLEADDGSHVLIEPVGTLIQLSITTPLSPACAAGRLTLLEAERLQKMLGKACAKVRGVLAHG